MTFRPLDPKRDAASVAELIRLADSVTTITAGSWLQRVGSLPARLGFRGWVAEADGRVAGCCTGYLNPEATGTSHLSVLVHPGRRRQGIGAALYDLVHTHIRELAAPLVLCGFQENDAGVRFAHARDFVEIRAETVSAVDPATVAAEAPADVDLRPIAELDPFLVYTLDAEVTVDVPQATPLEPVPYEEWLDHTWRHPLLTREGSFVAFVDGEPAALSLLVVDAASGRGTNSFTATRRAFRGRGLALAVKLASTRWAAANGVRSISTRNDETNAAMLAVNRRLGYRPAARWVEYRLDPR